MCTRGPSKMIFLAFSTLMGPSLVMEILEGICGMSVPESRFPAISPWGSSCPEPEDGEDGGCSAGVSANRGAPAISAAAPHSFAFIPIMASPQNTMRKDKRQA